MYLPAGSWVTNDPLLLSCKTVTSLYLSSDTKTANFFSIELFNLLPLLLMAWPVSFHNLIVGGVMVGDGVVLPVDMAVFYLEAAYFLGQSKESN